MKKWAALCAFSAVLALPTQAEETIVLNVAAFPAMDQIIKAALPAWEKKHPNVRVNVVSRQYGDHHTAMTTALATSSALPDIMAIEYGYLGRFVKGGALVDLTQAPYRAGDIQSQVVEFAYQQAMSKKHGLSALPADIGPGTLFYRKDILEKAGVSESDLTHSWASFVEAGRKIKAQTGASLLAHSRDLKDIIIRAYVKEGDGVYFNAKGKSIVGIDPRFKTAFTLAKKIHDESLDARVNAWSNEWGEGFKRGEIATQMMGAWLGGHLANWLAPKTSGKWRSAPLPEKAYASWGGGFYAIPKLAQHKALAWDLIQYLVLNKEQQLKAFKSEDAFPALKAAHDSEFFDQPIEFLGGQTARVQWRDSANNIVATRVFKHDPIAEEIVNSELDLVLNRNKDIDEALQDAHRFIKRRSRR